MKIYYYNRRLNGRYDSFRMKLQRAVAWSKRIALLGMVLSVTFVLGGVLFSTSTVIAHTNTVKLPVEAPVLNRIADCESGDGTKGSGTHTKNGQVVTNGNKNGSVDIGKYQINLRVWGAKASELGYDLATEDGNTAMAEWIYLNRGTGDWYASQNCWKRN